MANNNFGKNKWALFLLILSGIVIGGFIGSLTQNITYLSWLNYGKTFGMTAPVEIDLEVFYLMLKFSFKISMSSIIGIIVAIVIYNKL